MLFRSPENEFRSSVVPRANVADVRLTLDQLLGGPEVAELQNVTLGIHQDVLRFYVSVTDALSVDICNRSEKLVAIKFY